MVLPVKISDLPEIQKINAPSIAKSSITIIADWKILEVFNSCSPFLNSGYTGCHKYVPFARFPSNHVCKNEEKLLERLDQAILGVIDNPQKTQQTTAIGTLFWQTL